MGNEGGGGAAPEGGGPPEAILWSSTKEGVLIAWYTLLSRRAFYSSDSIHKNVEPPVKPSINLLNSPSNFVLGAVVLSVPKLRGLLLQVRLNGKTLRVRLNIESEKLAPQGTSLPLKGNYSRPIKQSERAIDLDILLANDTHHDRTLPG